MVTAGPEVKVPVWAWGHVLLHYAHAHDAGSAPGLSLASSTLPLSPQRQNIDCDLRQKLFISLSFGSLVNPTEVFSE